MSGLNLFAYYLAQSEKCILRGQTVGRFRLKHYYRVLCVCVYIYIYMYTRAHPLCMRMWRFTANYPLLPLILHNIKHSLTITSNIRVSIQCIHPYTFKQLPFCYFLASVRHNLEEYTLTTFQCKTVVISNIYQSFVIWL